MNRRFFIALAVVLPIAVFVPAKIAASWRPIALGRVLKQGGQPAHLIGASGRYVWVGSYFAVGDVVGSKRTLFDLETGKVRLLGENEGIANEGAWLWKISSVNEQLRLLLSDGDGAPVSYGLPKDSKPSLDYNRPIVRVHPALNRVELLLGQDFYRWRQSSGALERSAKIGREFGEDTKLSRDGEDVIDANAYSQDFGVVSGIYRGGTRAGSSTRFKPFAGFVETNSAQITPYGGFVFYDMNPKWPDKHWQVVDASDGRALWNYRRSSYEAPIVSPDETRLALDFPTRKIWEIRDTRTGQIIRALPLVPATNIGAFSPDGVTLYSVANGVLYRQRAR